MAVGQNSQELADSKNNPVFEKDEKNPADIVNFDF